MTYKIEPCQSGDYQTVKDMLSATDLPIEDLTPEKFANFLVARNEDDQMVGAVGVEKKGDQGLLRSLVVHPESRSSGLGKLLTEEIESLSKSIGLKSLYLLTTTAADFFLSLGYQSTNREAVPGPIAATEEFNSICPASATCLMKTL